jgi:hypothetical protein
VLGALAGTAVLLGVTYLLGVVFDRFADTLLHRIDGHHRARHALRHHRKRPLATTADPFPEDRYRVRVLLAGGAVAEFFNYLRSRIRLSRALAVYLPGLTVSATLAGAGAGGGAVAPSRSLVFVGVAYLLAFVLSLAAGGSWFAAPRTSRPGKMRRYGDSRGYFRPGGGSRRALSLARDVAVDPTVLAAAALLGAAGVLGAGGGPVGWFAVVGLALTALSGWSWWRISGTFRSFLADVDRWGGDRPPPAPPTPG